MIMRFALPPTGELATLRSGGAELVFAPECGARLVSFRVDGRDVLRPASTEALQTAAPYGFAGFPLMPYSGPNFGDGFRFDGEWFSLARNVPAEPTATHGEGWISPWRVKRMSDHAAEIRCEYSPATGAYPFPWRGEISFRLQPDALSIALSLTNRHFRPIPAGLGLHPYFPKEHGTTLAFDCTGVWPPDAPEAAGEGCGPLESGLDFRCGLEIGEMVLDRCFEGWDGSAALTAPDGFMTLIEADATFGKLQVYGAWDYPYICVEPVTNANDGFTRAALNVPGHAIVALDPGKTLAGKITIRTVSAPDSPHPSVV
jgi:aldose 1-epimerase